MPEPQRDTWKTSDWLRLGVTSSYAIAVSSGVLGIAYGAVAEGAGMSFPTTVAASLLVFTGAAQFSVIGLIGPNAPLSALVLSILVSLRLFLMAASLVGHFRALPISRQLLALPLVSDGSWATAMKSTGQDRHRWLVFMAAGVSIVALWTSGSAIGHAAAAQLPDTVVHSLVMAGPVFLSLLLITITRNMDGRSLWPWLVALGAAALVSKVLPSLPATLVGFAFGAILVFRDAKNRTVEQ